MSFQPSDPNYVERVRSSFVRQQFMGFIGATLTEVRSGYCEIRLPYKDELSQQHGYFHGGVIGTMADNASGYAAYTLMPATSSVLTVEYKLNLMAPGRGELLIARGHVVRSGRTLTVCQSEVFAVQDGKEHICAVALVTLMALIDKPDSMA